MNRVTIYSCWQMVPEQRKLMMAVRNILPSTPALQSRCNKPLAMNTEELFNILTYYHFQDNVINLTAQKQFNSL
jgi:hypothetical protein